MVTGGLSNAFEISGARRDQLDYLGDIVRLRLVQELNAIDAEPDRQTGSAERSGAARITYVFDANVFYFYIDTAKEHAHSEAIPILRQRVQRRFHDGAAAVAPAGSLVAPAVIAAEFLFSGRLPRQRQPIYVAEQHQREFQGRVSKLLQDLLPRERQLSKEEEKLLKERVSRFSRRLKQLEAGTRHGKPIPEVEVVRGLRRLLDHDLPAFIREFDLESIDQAAHLLRLIRGDIVRPLRLAPGIDRALLDEGPDEKRVGAWLSRLEDYRVAELDHRRREPDVAPRDTNRRADAEVLALLEEANDRLRERGVDNRFVLVTTSRAIQSASAFWLEETDRPLKDAFVRQLTQYLPFLNFRDMPNFISRPDAVFRLGTAMDALLQWGEDIGDRHEGATENRWRRYLKRLDCMIRGLGRIEAQVAAGSIGDAGASDKAAGLQAKVQSVLARVDFASLDRSLDDITRDWDEIVANSVGLNARLLSAHYKRHLGRVASAIEDFTRNEQLSERLGADYETRQITLADELARYHMRMAVRLMLADPSPESLRYALELKGARVSTYLDAKTAGEVMAVVGDITGGDSDGAARRLLGIVGRIDLGLPELNLIVAIVAFRMGRWENARNFAFQAVNTLRRVGSGGAEEAEPYGLSRLEAAMLGEAYWLMGAAKRIEVSIRPVVDDARWRRSARAALRTGREHERLALTLFDRCGDALGKVRSEVELVAIATLELLVDRAERRRSEPETHRAVRSRAESAMLSASALIDVASLDEPIDLVAVRNRVHATVAVAMLELVAHLDGLVRMDGIALALPRRFRQADADMATLARDGGARFEAWPLLLDLVRVHGRLDGAPDHAALLDRVAALELAELARSRSTGHRIELRLAREAADALSCSS